MNTKASSRHFAANRGKRQIRDVREAPIHTNAHITTGSIPKYRQLLQILRNDIVTGKIPIGAKIPSEEELSLTYGLSRGTVRKAIAQLEAERLIRTEHGVGSFVRSVHPRAIPFHFSVDGGLGFDSASASYEVLAQEVIASPMDIAERLRLAPGAPVIHVVRRRRLDGLVMSHTTRFLPESLCPDLLQADLRKGSIHDFLVRASELPLLRAELEFEARLMNDEEAASLEAVSGDKVVVVNRLTYTAPNRPAVLYRGLFREQYQISVNVNQEIDPSEN